MEKGRKKIHYAWFILAGCCIMQGAGLGLINNCSGVFSVSYTHLTLPTILRV